jgi:hypothetical protein
MRLRSTKDIFKDHTEISTINFDESLSELDLPLRKQWSYERNMQLEDVDVWEVIYEEAGGTGVYAAWEPYAEFYMLRLKDYTLEFFYGPGAQAFMLKYLKTAWNVTLSTAPVWVDESELYLFDATTFTKHASIDKLINPIGTIFSPDGKFLDEFGNVITEENHKHLLNCCS